MDDESYGSFDRLYDHPPSVLQSDGQVYDAMSPDSCEMIANQIPGWMMRFTDTGIVSDILTFCPTSNDIEAFYERG